MYEFWRCELDSLSIPLWPLIGVLSGGYLHAAFQRGVITPWLNRVMVLAFMGILVLPVLLGFGRFSLPVYAQLASACWRGDCDSVSGPVEQVKVVRGAFNRPVSMEFSVAGRDLSVAPNSIGLHRLPLTGDVLRVGTDVRVEAQGPDILSLAVAANGDEGALASGFCPSPLIVMYGAPLFLLAGFFGLCFHLMSSGWLALSRNFRPIANNHGPSYGVQSISLGARSQALIGTLTVTVGDKGLTLAPIFPLRPLLKDVGVLWSDMAACEAGRSWLRFWRTLITLRGGGWIMLHGESARAVYRAWLRRQGLT